jgi:sulfite reductase (NADPH) flavoprotein alpha-component
MSMAPHLPIPGLIPEHAPFSSEQRVWLNGLFAGLLALDSGLTALSPQEAARLLPDLLGDGIKQPAEDVDDGAPWHDPAMPLVDRIRLAEGRPLQRRMMAAMAQQDCGQCGYNCNDYARVLVEQTEERLNLCVPGGKDTARALKALRAELDPSAASVPALPPQPAASPAPKARGTRDCPVEAALVARTRLNKPGSQKETWHIEFDLGDAGLDYAVGDSFGLMPTNDPALVDAVIAAINAPPDFPIGGRTLHDVLIDGVSLSPAPDMLFQLISYLVGGERRQKAKALAAGQDPDGDAATLDVLAAIEKFSGIHPDPEAFIEALDPLQPRVYSIASSPRVDPRRIALTVDTVRYRVGKRERLGVGSTFLADRLPIGTHVQAYLQKAHAFALPSDPSVPIIMIGPGTGVAPFRAFLHERMATKAPGRNWLFFGHQHRNTDFFYEDELVGMRAAGVLNRLTLAWSRDAEHKIYVQDRMRDVGRDLWAWMTEGARIYVCGDAKKMAKDVECALIDIVATHGARTQEEAFAFVTQMKKSGRYQQDVY